MIKWTRGTENAPKDRRLLLIAAPIDRDQSAGAEAVVGHWHEAREEFVVADPPHPFGRCRPELKVEWWAELPTLPEAVNLRTLSEDDLWG
jgi:hypothetical protein